MHLALILLAKHYGVEFSERSCSGDSIYDGKTIAMHSHKGPLSDHDLLHEVCHYIVASDKQRSLREYGLGYTASWRTQYAPSDSDLNPWTNNESEIQEKMAQFLSVKFGQAYEIPVALSEEPDYATSWEQYLDMKLPELSAEISWQALIRLDAKGLLHQLPF